MPAAYRIARLAITSQLVVEGLSFLHVESSWYLFATCGMSSTVSTFIQTNLMLSSAVILFLNRCEHHAIIHRKFPSERLLHLQSASLLIYIE